MTWLLEIRQNRYRSLLIAAFAATAVHCQNGPAVPGVLFEMEQPPEQFVDGVGPFVSNRGVLRRDPGLRQHLH